MDVESVTQDNSTTAARHEWAASFIARGLSVLILHDVSAGQCSCLPRWDGRECKPGSQGKHPRANVWQNAGITSMAALRAELAEYPNANLGILTGPASRVWVLDEDPLHGGDVRLAELIAEHGPLPVTYTVRTGSGGRHFYWLLPEDFTPGTSRQRLPVGLDVRGAGGQVVAPGSVSLRGSYSVELDVPPVHAPEWLLSYIRPVAPVDQRSLTESHGVSLETFDVSAAGDRADYVRAAVGRELHRLREATPGGRGHAAVAVSRALIELANSPWAQLDVWAVRAAYLEAAAVAAALGTGGGHDFDMGQAEDIWTRSLSHVAGRGRPVPAELDAGGVVPAVDFASLGAGVPPFGAGASTATLPGAGLANPFAIPGQRDGSELGSLTESHGVSVETVDVSGLGNPGFEALVAREVLAQTVRAEARRRVAAAAAAGHAESVARLRAALLDPADLDTLPENDPLVSGWLVKDSVARISGAPGSGKSFVVMDLAGCVGTGTEWQGHEVAQGNVVVLVAEGVRGIAKRRRAWEKAYGKAMTSVKFLPLPVQAAEPEWDAFVQVMEEVKPVLVVLDTQARVTVGVDENSATEMGVFVHAVERLRLATGACVLLVHHTSADSDRARGSTAVNGAVQTELVVRRTRNEVTIVNTKQKDDAAQPDLRLAMIQIDLGMRDGEPVNSVVLRPSINLVGSEDLDASGILNAVMREVFGQARGGTKGEVKSVVLVERRLMSKAAFYRAWNRLVADHNIAQIEGTSSWRYVEVEERAALMTPAAGGGLTITS